jgi:hypothetical protein
VVTNSLRQATSYFPIRCFSGNIYGPYSHNGTLYLHQGVSRGFSESGSLFRLDYGLPGESMGVSGSLSMLHLRQCLTCGFSSRLGGMTHGFSAIGAPIGLKPLSASVPYRENQQNQCSERDNKHEPVSQDSYSKWRVPVCVLGCVVACGLCLSGLRLIQAAGLVVGVSFANLLKVAIGLLLMVVSWVVFQAALDVLDFGRIIMWRRDETRISRRTEGGGQFREAGAGCFSALRSSEPPKKIPIPSPSFPEKLSSFSTHYESASPTNQAASNPK